MRIKIAVSLYLGLLVSGIHLMAAEQPAPLTREVQAELIKDLSEGLNEIYIFPDVATKMVERINGKLERGEYDALLRLPAFTQQLTEDLQSISHDLHLSVRPSPPPRANGLIACSSASLTRLWILRLIMEMMPWSQPSGSRARIPSSPCRI